MESATFMRKPPKGDEQTDLFTPNLFDVSTKDSRSVMDVSVFRLSKRDQRRGEIIKYDLGDGGYIEVAGGAHGMASIWDYDIVLMMVSHVTEQYNAMMRGERDDMPDRYFKPHAREILKFCRRDSGGKNYKQLEAALARLEGTAITVVRRQRAKGQLMRVADGGARLIGRYTVRSFERSGNIAEVMIEIPDWIYKAVTESDRPDVLTVHNDYFLIDSGIGRFVYRLARTRAGRNYAVWGFRTLYERSGSTSEFKGFCRTLRGVIKADQLPEYHLIEEPGKRGPLLVMVHRKWWEKTQELWSKFDELGGHEVMAEKMAGGMDEENAYRFALDHLRKTLNLPVASASS